MNALELINSGSSRLRQKKIITYRLDSEILLSKVLEKKREEIIINLEQKICSKHISTYNNLIQRRSQNEPMAYIIKEKELSIDFENKIIWKNNPIAKIKKGEN